MSERKLRILLIDSSEYAQKALEKSLTNIRDCEVEKCSNVSSALHDIAESPPDFIVSNWQFSDYSALDLLSALSVRDEWKQIPVLIASDLENDKVYSQSIDHGAIGVVFKPFDLKILRRHLDSLFPLRDLQEDTRADKHGKLLLANELKKVDRLAPMPKLVQSVLAVCSDPNASVRQLAEIVKIDDALSARILRIVNSAYYGFHREISNVDHALVVLGFEEVKNIALAACIIHAYPYESDRVFNREKFWAHSLCCAYTARALRKFAPEIISQDAFVIGLLHDFGKIVLSQLFHNHFIKSVSEAQKHNEPLHKTELKFADLHHADVGGRVSEAWELPPALTRAIEFHHAPEEAYSHEYSIHLAHLANYFTHKANIGNSGNPAPDNVSLVSINAFGLQTADLDDVWQSLGVDVDAINSMIV